MKKKVIGVDIDNVLSNTDKKIRSLIHQYFSIKSNIEDIKYWSYSDSLCLKPDEERFVFNELHQKHLLTLESLSDAQYALKKLCGYYYVWLITSRPKYTQNDTELWLNNHSISYDKIIFTERKLNYANNLSFQIDDNPQIALEFALVGIAVILFDYPWNRQVDHKLISRVSGWNQIINDTGIF